MNFSQYTKQSVEEIFLELNSSVQGLTEQEISLRQEQYGFNEIALNAFSALSIFIRQIKSPFFYLILFAAVVSFFLRELTDGIVITITAIINISIGFFQEYRAEKTIFLLRKYIAQNVKVLRVVDSVSLQTVIEKKFLVPGDVVLLEAGDIVPADLRLIELESFMVDESILTGESISVVKSIDVVSGGAQEIFQATNMVFAGSAVSFGKAKGIVTAIGRETAFGNIANLVSSASKPSAYEKNILYFSKLVLRIVLVTIFLMFLANIVLKGFGGFFNMALFAVALIISILPEALPAVVTFSLAKGSMKMAKLHVVVRRLSAIEGLGNIEILCTDKTGTITENRLSLEKIVSRDQEKCLTYGVLRDDATFDSQEREKLKKTLNPFDTALLDRADENILLKAKSFSISAELPFDSVRMRASVLIEGAKKSQSVLIVRGAPDVLLKLCNKFEGNQNRKNIENEIVAEGINGKRVLAVAFKKINKKASQKYTESLEKGLTFLGYFVFEDPLKSTAEEAIRLSKKLGVEIKIITGDAKEVAGYIGKKTGLLQDSGSVILGSELVAMSRDDFDDACDSYSVFARISPEVKYDILKSLQKKYEVGFLGEGINDAPALKIAHVGIAVPSASDISREVADVVMLQKDLRVIVEGIKEGRMIFANINKYIKCMLASNFGNFYSIAIISLFINYLPMLPIQILIGNLLSDFPLIAVATDSIDVEELKKPKMYQLHNILPLVISIALVSTLFDFIFFMIFKNNTPAVIQSLWFVESILAELALIYVIRTRHAFWKAKMPSKALLFFTIADAMLIIVLPFLAFGQSIFHFVALPFNSLLILFALVIACTLTSEIVKLIYFKYFSGKTPQVKIIIEGN